MQHLQRLEQGDKIFLIDNESRIREIELTPTHLKEDRIERHAIAGNYHLKSDIVESGQDVKLEKVIIHEELDDHYVKQRRVEYKDTDKVAYLSLADAQSHLSDMNYQRSVMTELQEDANRQLESHLTAINLILSDYFDRVDRHDIADELINSDKEHKRLLDLRKSIS